MTFQDCPAGKWPVIVDAEKKAQAKELVRSVKETNVLTDPQRRLLAEFDEMMKGSKGKVSSCVPCVKKMVDDLHNQLKSEEVLLSNEETPQPKKRGRRKRKSE
jgi:ribosomal protein S6E (S10)